MESVFRLQTNATLLTAGVSLWFLVRLWRQGELYGTQQVIFCAWFVLALITQLVGRGPVVWGVGLLAQLVLATVLVLKDQIDNIF